MQGGFSQLVTASKKNALDAALEEELNELKSKGLFRELKVLDGRQGAVVKIAGKEFINLSSNNYLGLTNHPRLCEAAINATREFGVGAGAVRTISGTMRLHAELEKRIAEFKKTESSIVFQSGFNANIGTIGAVVGEGDLIISDELNHASIIDGCRLTKAERKIYKHKDTESLEEALKESRNGYGKTLIITDGVFSMDGDIAPLDGIVELAEKYGAAVMVDDAHASGVLGKNGRGTVDHFNINGRVDIQMGTLSKALGCLGGYIAGSRNLRDFLVHRGRPFLFSTAIPPSVAASAIAAIDVLESEPEIFEKLWSNTKFFKKELGNLGFDTGISETPITPIIAGDEAKTMQLSDELFKNGVFAQGIAFPTVPRGRARIRTIVTAMHSKEQLEECLGVLERAGKKLSII